MTRFLLLLSTLAFVACSTPESIQREKDLIQQQVVDNPTVTEGVIENGNSRLRYFHNGDLDKPALVFLHGTPSSWKSMSRYMLEADLLESLQVYAIDRPGWGASHWQANEDEDFFKQQAREISHLLSHIKDKNGNKPIILAGHSFGSSLSPAVAFYHPELVDGLVLMSGALDPELGKPRWYNYAASTWLVSKFLRERSKQANYEIWRINPGLEAIVDFWKNPGMPIVVIQGGQDKLVDPGSAEFVKNRVDRQWLTLHFLPEQNHFTHVERRELVMSSILEVLAQARQ